MLGDVSPQELKVVSSGVFYPGRDHVDVIDITRWDGRQDAALDFSAATRLVLVLLNTAPLVAIDSEQHPNSLWVEGARVYVDLSTYALAPATYTTHLVVHDDQHPRGQVLIDNQDTVYQVEVRVVGEPGTTPPPRLEYVLDAPGDGGVYARQRGKWVLIPSVVDPREAGETLSALRVVYELDGVVRYLDSHDTAHIELASGVTLGAAELGEQVQVQRSGAIDDENWSWTPGPVWLGAAGALTQTPPTAGYSLVVGVALSATRLAVDLQPPINLE